MKKKILISGLVMILLCSIVIATPSFFVEQNKEYDLKISCFDADNSFCTIATVCTVTVSLPNSTVIINNQNMTFNTAYYNYTIPNSNLSVLGEYPVIAQCTGTTNGFQTFSFEVTADGLEPVSKETNRDIREVGVTALIIVFILILFIVGLSKEDPTLTALSGLLFMSDGVFIAINGISTYNNSFVNGFALLLMGLGMYIVIRSYIDSDEFQQV